MKYGGCAEIVRKKWVEMSGDCWIKNQKLLMKSSPYISMEVLDFCVDMVGVVGSSPIAPTKNGREIKGPQTCGPFFCLTYSVCEPVQAWRAISRRARPMAGGPWPDLDVHGLEHFGAAGSRVGVDDILQCDAAHIGLRLGLQFVEHGSHFLLGLGDFLRFGRGHRRAPWGSLDLSMQALPRSACHPLAPGAVRTCRPAQGIPARGLAGGCLECVAVQ